MLSAEFKADMAFKCHLCKKLYMNNLEFMKHLSLHVEAGDRASAVDLTDLIQCRYCLKEFEDPDRLGNHMEELHLKKGPHVCRICDVDCKGRNFLIGHMLRMHVKFEMPYNCGICGYRSSFHRDVVDHFMESHDRTDKLQCPKCLKTFTLCTDKGYNHTIGEQFVSHLQAHLDKKVRCKRCRLTFHTESQVKAHIEKDHPSYLSFQGELELRPSTSSSKPDYSDLVSTLQMWWSPTPTHSLTTKSPS